MVSLCSVDHRFAKHTAGTLGLSGTAPHDDRTLDEDPWRAADPEVRPAGPPAGDDPGDSPTPAEVAILGLIDSGFGARA